MVKSKLDLNKIRISKHAIQRFKERSWFLGMNTEVPDKQIEERVRRLLCQAEEETLSNKKARWELFKRAILRSKEGGLNKTKTFTCNGWRFVVDMKRKTLVTVERVNVFENHLDKIFQKESKTTIL